MQPLPPNDIERIGPYRILAELGRGAMGRVLLGAGLDGRLVAVKMIREWLVEDEEFRARFREEVQKSRQVSGHYTAAVVKAGPDDPIPWLATDYLRGPTLGEAVEAAGPLPEAVVLRLAAGLASALESIHEAGVIHRDLKPSNVILEASGPRVIDFGIARTVEGADLTRTGAVVGTPGFMSPEQARSQPLTPASDVFSLGSVLVMACTGSSPFAAASTFDVMNNVVRAEPDLGPVPGRLREIAARCLAADPADRPDPASLLALIGTVPPATRPWPDAVSALAEEQHRELVRLLGNAGEDATLVDNGPTLITDPNRPTWVGRPQHYELEPSPPGPQSSEPQPSPPGPQRSKPQPSPYRPVPPPVHVTASPPPVPPAAAPSQGNTVMGVFLALLIVVFLAVVLWRVYGDGDDSYTPSSDRVDYVEDCESDGYSESECEESWTNDTGYTWTGELYSDDVTDESTYYEETAAAETAGSREVYIADCEYDGHSTSDCEASWADDPSYTWTGELFTDDEDDTSEEREAYLAECEYDGYSTSECETSWYNDPSYTWTGELFTESEEEPLTQYELYVEECEYDGYSSSDCEASWANDPSYTWTGVLY
ncbi:serine/threonine-protein kinase [Glycomyces algeriensis]|uniref:Protein kinase domain-containing protein n=1 Tax=Glycomyces algeriensis TaxID=256037 RepID=A0A9W6LFQ0_9ACTN|nr:serine/threonine-protein kinase [Glycomyces algeriensis]MDA1366085.1 serine/threonine-protein kinase [Glycomyces algeriensis]MDR7349148.1 serine/threonine protein kinase [Glycomyces algeriensis]GLI41848.1 hypothetical protein GALLR39Z86_16980 [Glycomyces algeriensis]